MKQQYIRFNLDTKKLKLRSPFINLYPMPCLHIGAPQSDVMFIKQHIKRIKDDPAARVVLMGDGGECVTKASKGDIYTQLLSPQQQVDLLVELFTPVKDKILFAIRGNHGHRIYKETGLSFDKTLAVNLGTPYMGVNTFCNLVVNNSSYNLFFHHGIDSGVSLQSKVNKAVSFQNFIHADAVFTAHSHVCMDLPPAALLYCDNTARKVKTLLRKQYICGCGYDSRTGYAADKGYPPLLPAYLVVVFDGRTIHGAAQKSQICRKYYSDGQHPVDGDYGVREFIDG